MEGKRYLIQIMPDSGPLLLTRGLSDHFAGAVTIERESGILIVRQMSTLCIICGEPAVDYLFGKGVCSICLRHAKIRKERGY